ncbi:TetR/AcrR family transcriptional regulator [Gordonia sp. DT101]|uniref:TetR/AcrR family transcriptional regulator n=1 Tax=Gordonia sp. DT101 TaxID=3416545 RepID=UPI003CF32AB0
MTTGFEDLWPAPGRGVTSTRTTEADKATEDRLLEATDRLVRQVGVRRLSMSEVARAAGVARGTLYRYYESRDVLLEALRRRTTEWFFDEVTEALTSLPTLSEQVGEFSEIIARTINPPRDQTPHRARSGTNPAAMIHILGTHGTEAVERTASFLLPYVEAARERGEIPQDTDVAGASAWLARILLSFTIFQVSSNPDDDGRPVSELIVRYAVEGLAGPRGDR